MGRIYWGEAQNYGTVGDRVWVRVGDRDINTQAATEINSTFVFVTVDDAGVARSLTQTSPEFLRGETTTFTHVEPVPEERPTPTSSVKVLFSVINGTEQIFYIGGDRKTAKEILRLPTSRAASACLQNTGPKEDDWLFSVNHWAATYPVTPTNRRDYRFNYGFYAYINLIAGLEGYSTVQTISPSIKSQNWQLDNLPNGLFYAGSGVWFGHGFPYGYGFDGYPVRFDSATGVAYTVDDPLSNEAAWHAKAGYDFAIDLVASTNGFSTNIASSLIWDQKISVTTGRISVPVKLSDISTRDTQGKYYADYEATTRELEFAIAPDFSSNVITRKIAAQTNATNFYKPAIISPDRKTIIYRRVSEANYFVPHPVVDYPKSMQSTIYLLKPGTQERTLSLGEHPSMSDRDFNTWLWQPYFTTLVQSATSTKAYVADAAHISDSPLFFEDAPPMSIDAVKTINPATRRGGIKVFSLDGDAITELPEEAIAPKMLNLGYEDDPTLFIWSISYHPKSGSG